MDKKQAAQLDAACQAFRDTTRIRKTLFLTLLTTFDAASNEYYLGRVQRQLTMEDLFESI